MQELFGDKQFLIKLSKAKMPFGKYKDTYLSDLPEYYMIWYKNKGFPKGQIGEMMAVVYELKLNGIEYLLQSKEEYVLYQNNIYMSPERCVRSNMCTIKYLN